MVRKKKRKQKSHELFWAFVAAVLIIILIGLNLPEEKQEIHKEKISLRDRNFIFLKENVEKSPVIIVLHGTRQDSEVWFQNNPQGAFVEKAVEKGYAIIAPDSKTPFCEEVRQWDVRDNSTDLEFFDEIFNWIWFREDLDSEKIYVAGISNGGTMASKLAEQRGNNIRAIMIHSATNAKNAKITNGTCYFQYFPNQTAISANHPRTMLIHGTNDTIISYENSLAYFNSLKEAGIGVVLIPKIDGDHFWYEEYNDLILSWFN